MDSAACWVANFASNVIVLVKLILDASRLASSSLSMADAAWDVEKPAAEEFIIPAKRQKDLHGVVMVSFSVYQNIFCTVNRMT